jgi:TPR repeat protein
MLKARELSQITVPDQYLPMDIINARYYIEKAAYLGFAKAQTKMGAAYELCQLGCSFNPALSLHYNNLAARQGEPEAEMAISKWFLSGYEGVFRKSESLAFEYAQRAAQTGLGTAEFAMGYFYEIGIHVPVNLKEARSWYVKAAEHGNRDASARVEGISRSKTLSRKDHERIAVAKITSGRANQRANGSQAPVQFPRPPASSYSHIGKPESATSYHPNQSFTSAPPSAAYQTSPYGGMNRPSSAATIGGFNQYGTLPMASEPQRPYSSAGAPGYGRPGNGGPGYGGPGYGEPNDGGQGNIYPQGGNRHPGLPATPVPSRPYPVDNTDYMNNVQKPLPPVDIGFTAPPDFSGADRQKPSQRPEYPNNPAPGYPGYVRPPPGRNYNGPPERTSSRPTVSPSPAQSYGDGHVPSPLVPSNPSTGRPPRGASLAQRPPPGSILGPAPQSMNTPPPPSSSLGGHFSGPSAASNAEGRKLAKGPSTFEAMGVPQTKKEEDCVSRSLIPRRS